MAGPAGRGVQPESDVQWITLEDFSAGIYDYTSTPVPLNNTDLIVPGAGKLPADPNITYACIALPGGGLGPLPEVVQAYEFTESTPGLQNWLTGFLAHDELAGAGGETLEFLAIFEADDGVNHFMTGYSYDANNLVFHPIVSTTNPSGAGIFGAPYPVVSRMAASSPTTTPGAPVIVFPSGGPAQAFPATGQVYVYPSPAARTTYGTLPLIAAPGDSVAGQIIAHENRIVVLSGITYPYPAGGGWETNEQISFTDPPNSDLLGFQQTVLAAEDPYGYGAGGSISAGELFLVKKRGGGLQVTGDLLTPNVTFLPGVQPTGGIFGRGASGSAGFAYGSYNEGLWLWNGANTSQKISGQLDDLFFLPTVFEQMASNNYGFFCEWVGDKLYVSNNWLYDLRTNSWWRFYPTTNQGGTDLFWTNVVAGPDIYCGPLSIVQGENFAFRFNLNTPVNYWIWQSLPIKITDNRLIDLREIVVRASVTDSSGIGSNQVRVTVINAGGQVGHVTTPNSEIRTNPRMVRMPIGGANNPLAGSGIPFTTDQIVIRIEGLGNSTPAPIVHSIGLGFNQRQHAPTVGVSG